MPALASPAAMMIAVHWRLAAMVPRPMVITSRFRANLNSAQVGGGGRLGLVVGGHQPGGGEMVGTADVEADMPVWPDAAQKEADAAQVANPLLELLAPLVHPPQHGLLGLFQFRLRLPGPQAQIDATLRPDRVERLLGLQPDLRAVDQQGLGLIELKTVEVELVYVGMKTVLLRGVDRIEFVDLHEMQPAHLGFAVGVDARFL